MTLKFSFFYKHSNKDYFLGLLQKVANAHSVEIRAEMCDELLCVFVSAENAEILGAFADALENEIPLSLYFRLKGVELCEKPLSAENTAQNLENIFSVSEINAIKNPSDLRFCDIFSDSTQSASWNNKQIDSPDLLKTALYNLCDDLAKGQGIALSTSKGAISLSIKSDDFDFILANDISTISLYTRASADELNALASFEKPLIDLAIKEVFVSEVGAKNALFILPYDIILCCISSILLKREITFVYGKKIDLANLNLVYDSTHKSDFFEIIMGQNGYFLKKDFLDLSANLNAKNLSNLWDFLDFSFDDFRGESKNNDIFIVYLSTKNPTHLANLRNKTQILTIAFDKNPKNILQKISTLENGDKLIANFKKAFEARYEAIQSLDSTPQWTQNIMDIFECAAMILGNERDKNAIFDLAKSYIRDIGPKIDFKNTNSSLGEGNSPLELHSADSANFECSQTPSLVSHSKFAENHESQTENPSVVDSTQGVEFNEKNRASAHRISPDSWCKKSESKGAVLPPADFLLESEKRGTPPKSEKRQLLARRGSGAGGAALLRKENGDKDSIDLKADLIAESHKKIDSRFALDSRDLDSSPTAQNDESLDCFGDESSRNDESAHDSSKSPQNEFALFYDESRTIRSVISFTLAGSEPEVIAFGIIESLVDYLVLIFRDAQEKFGTKNMGIIGDIFANKIFFDKITQKIPKDFNLVFPKFLDYD